MSRGQEPVSPDATGRPRPAPVDALAEATVLVVDDHESNVALLEVVLRDAGVADVRCLTDARDVVSCCLELRPDLVLLDLHMPHMDGCAVLTALQAALPADTFLPVLVLTADSSAAARKAALDAGAKDFLTKPFDHVETILRVRNLLEMGALYRSVQGHNARLQAELEERSEEERRLSAERLRRRERIELVLRDEKFSMVFQPVLDLQDGGLVGVEALARFDGEPRRPPNEWFADAADVGLGLELELAAVEAAVRHLDQVPAHAFMSVNVSAAAAKHEDLRRVLASVPGSRLVLELTEHARIEDYEPLLAAMDAHRLQGMRIAVDDTGAGYAGLRHILRLRPDLIKLDLDLTRDIHADPARRALAGSLRTFADELGAVVVAEGIELREELVTLRSLGVPWGQGYHLGRPAALPATDQDSRPDRPWRAANARAR
jgi:EAL domain-containing protein (putative c-di-GMP-specific phosphodiesterase class I)/AmiR/NasT family two-component response regulator